MNTVSARFGTLVIGLLLARLLNPGRFGVFAVAIVALLAARALGQLGVSTVLTRWPADPGEIAPTAMTTSLVSGAAIYAGCYFGAPAFAGFMGAPQATSVVRVIALNVVISAAVAVPRAMVHRRSPRRRVTVDQVDNWLGVAVTIWLASTGFGLMSVGVGRIAGSLAAAVLFIALSPRSLRIGFNRHRVRALLRNGLPVAVSGALTFALTNADQVVVGHVLHTPDLSFYVLALCLGSWPVTLFSQPVRDMAPAVFARFRRGPHLASSAFVSSASLLAGLTLPTCILITTSAVPLTHLAYGPRWAPAAHVLVWLAPLAALRVFYEFTNDYFAVLASSRRSLTFQSIWLTALVPSLVVGARLDGILGVAMLQVALAVLVLLPWYLTELRPVSVWPQVPAAFLGLPLLGAAVVGLVTFGARRMVRDNGLDLGIGSGAALTVMAFLVYRMRTVLAAVRRTAAATARRPARVAGAVAPVLGSVFEPPLYPVLPSRTAVGERPPGSGSGDQDLGGKVRAGMRWSTLNTIVVRICNFLVGVILARTVFGPTVWGLYAVSQIVVAILLSANELGVSAAIIRWDGDVRVFARTVLTLSVVSSTVIYIGLYAGAPYVARLLGSPDATGMLRILCICVIIDGVSCVPMALLTRNFAQGRRMIVDSLNFVVSTGVTLMLAFSGHGAISFAWGAVAGCTVATVTAMVLAPGFVWPGWNTADAGRLLRFGLPLAGASLLVLGVFNVDSAIVGATLGPAMLGLYQLAFNISSWPVSSISQAVGRVSFAGFSRVADSPRELADAFTRALALLMALTIPACVLLATLAGPLISHIYGTRWLPAAHALSLLAVLGLMRVAYGLAYDCMAAANRRQTLMWVQALWLGTLIPILIIGARTHGITGVGAGHVLVAATIVGPAFLWALSRIGITVGSILGSCLRPILGGILMAAVSLAIPRLTGDGLPWLAATVAAATAVYLPIVFPMRALLRRAAPSPAEYTEADAA